MPPCGEEKPALPLPWGPFRLRQPSSCGFACHSLRLSFPEPLKLPPGVLPSYMTARLSLFWRDRQRVSILIQVGLQVATCIIFETLGPGFSEGKEAGEQKRQATFSVPASDLLYLPTFVVSSPTANIAAKSMFLILLPVISK